jgi:hypothetical protein
VVDWPSPLLVAIAGGVGGVALGLAARLGRFCTLAAIEDAIFGGDYIRIRMWALALAVAIAGVTFLSASGHIDSSGSLYHRLDLNPVAWVIGGILFGIGMAFCGTCGYGTLARVGGGDLRALFVMLVMGIAAYMAIAGPTAELRLLLINPLAISEPAGLLRTYDQTVGPGSSAAIAGSLAIALAIAFWALAGRGLFHAPVRALWALVVGLAIVSGWWATGWLGADPFQPQPIGSHTYSVPLGQTLIYFMTMSSTPVSFGVGATLGVIAGSFAGAMIKREFRWEGADDAREMRRHLVGGFLMGTGGVYAGGCTIGQGLSAASVLAFSAPIVMVSIWLGVWLGLTYVMEGTLRDGLRALADRFGQQRP